jgi:hypothetical protein
MGWSVGTPFERFGHDRLDPDKPQNLTFPGEVRWYARALWRWLRRKGSS